MKLRPFVGSALFVALLSLGSTYTFATPSDNPSSSSKAGVNSFVRGAALPKWMQPLGDLPATERTDPVVFRLSEVQAWVDTAPAMLFSRAIQVNDQSALGTIGQYGISYFPAYQKLLLHKVVILRGNKSIDHTATVNTRLLQRETNMESGVYGGATTVQLLLDDVRIGDTLWITYTVVGENPVFGQRWASEFSWDNSSPIELRRVTILHPRKRKLYWRQLGDFRRGDVTPTIDEIGDLQRLRFEGRGLEAMDNESAIPSDYLPARVFQVSEYSDWHAVAGWADSLFPKAAATPTLKALAQQFSQESTPAQQVAAALRWVQNEVRYFSVSIGENSHRPHAPESVIHQRFGDCKDKSYLLVSILDQLGIAARPVLILADAPKLPAKIIATPTLFNHMIVQVTVDGHQYYLDPTRTGQVSPLEKLPASFPGASGLVVDAATDALVTLPESTNTEPKYEHVENISLASFDGQASLQTQEIYRGNYAEWARLHYPTLAPKELKKEMLALYEKQYPGIVLLDTPSLKDDPAQNKFEIAAHYTIPKPLIDKESRYDFEFDSQIIDGTLGIPKKVVRNYPFELPRGKYHGRYRLTIQWPATFRVSEPPFQQTFDNSFFTAHEEFQYQGQTLNYLMDYHVKRDKIEADELPDLQVKAKSLNDLVAGTFHVPKSYIAAPEFTDYSFRELEDIRLGARVAEHLASYKDVKQQKFTDDLCNTLIDVMRFYPVTDTDDLQARNRWATLDSAFRAEINDPETRKCLVRMLFAKGEFQQGLDIYRAGTAWADDSRFLLDLAWARFYSGDAEGAIADMERYRQAKSKLANAALSSVDVSSEIALYQRVNRTIPVDLLDYAAAIPDGPWPRPLIAMQVGAIEPEQLMTILKALPNDAAELAMNDARFYIGQRALVTHDLVTANSAFGWLKANGVRTSSIYLPAMAEWRLLQPHDLMFESGIKAWNNNDSRGAIAIWQEGAKNGSPMAQYKLGTLFYNGRNVDVDYVKALYWFKLAAQQGYPRALNHLGIMYGTGNGVPKDDAIADIWYLLAAEKGDPFGQFNYGEHLEKGLGVEKNYEQAIKWYLLAAEQGDVLAQFHLGYMYEQGQGVAQDYNEARKWYRRAAFADDADAQFSLGVIYDFGRGVAQDYKVAARWYRLAASQGNVVAAYNLGCFYDYGHGVTQDYQVALKWYRLAADKGNSDAQNNIGFAYETGQGVSRDLDQALKWYRVAADQGNPYGQRNIGKFYRYGWAVTQDYQEAIKWFQLAANQGLALAQNDLAHLYQFGQGVTPDLAKAAQWYRKSAEQGNTDAQMSLALLLEKGTGVEQDNKEAAKWLTLAADKNIAAAQYEMALLYLDGTGVEKDLKVAIDLMHKAAQSGYVNAQNTLGKMYQYGLGGEQDYKEALRWYQLAADKGNADAQYQLAGLYLMGWGVPKNYTEAFRWTRLSAQQGYTPAQNQMGYMYIEGYGVAIDYAESVKWYQKTASKGDAIGQNNLGYSYEIGQGVQQDYLKALELYRKAVAQKMPAAQSALAGMYETGHGVPVDMDKALELYLAAVKQNNPEAQRKLALLYEEGRGVESNPNTAFSWFEKAANVGDQPAMERLIKVYEKGELGQAADSNLAKKWRDKLNSARSKS